MRDVLLAKVFADLESQKCHLFIFSVLNFRTVIFHMHVGYLNPLFTNSLCVTFILFQKSDLRVFLLSVKAMHADMLT